MHNFDHNYLQKLGVNIVPVNLSACKFLRSDMRLELDLNVSL